MVERGHRCRQRPINRRPVALESKASILDRLRRFFRNRPTLESLKDKGIYQRKLFSTFYLNFCSKFQPNPSLEVRWRRSGYERRAQYRNSCVYVRPWLRKRDLKPTVSTGSAVIYHKYKKFDVKSIRVSFTLNNLHKSLNFADKYQLLKSETDIHVITGALKLFFRELQTPAFPHEMSKVLRITTVNHASRNVF